MFKRISLACLAVLLAATLMSGRAVAFEVGFGGIGIRLPTRSSEAATALRLGTGRTSTRILSGDQSKDGSDDRDSGSKEAGSKLDAGSKPDAGSQWGDTTTSRAIPLTTRRALKIRAHRRSSAAGAFCGSYVRRFLSGQQDPGVGQPRPDRRPLGRSQRPRAAHPDLWIRRSRHRLLAGWNAARFGQWSRIRRHRSRKGQRVRQHRKCHKNLERVRRPRAAHPERAYRYRRRRRFLAGRQDARLG